MQALALLDALAGEADAFWEAYANEVLPKPEALTLPLCLPPRLLRELQHEEVEAAALAQKASGLHFCNHFWAKSTQHAPSSPTCCMTGLQERLRNLFPGLAAEMGPELPSFFEWAFACVRSRAFRLSGDRYAFVPFLDIANHSPTPNAGFR